MLVMTDWGIRDCFYAQSESRHGMIQCIQWMDNPGALPTTARGDLRGVTCL
jgi:hypothetical protein